MNSHLTLQKVSATRYDFNPLGIVVEGSLGDMKETPKNSQDIVLANGTGPLFPMPNCQSWQLRSLQKNPKFSAKFWEFSRGFPGGFPRFVMAQLCHLSQRPFRSPQVLLPASPFQKCRAPAALGWRSSVPSLFPIPAVKGQEIWVPPEIIQYTKPKILLSLDLQILDWNITPWSWLE